MMQSWSWSLYSQYSQHCADNLKIGMTALHFVVAVVLCTQGGFVQSTQASAMSSDSQHSDLSYFDGSDPDEPDQSQDPWTDRASKFRLRRAFMQFAWEAQHSASTQLRKSAAHEGYAAYNLHHAFTKWQVRVYHKRGLAHIRSERFKSLWLGDPKIRAAHNIREGAADNPRTMVLAWPRGKEMVSIISLSANYQVTATGEQDKRKKDIQVLFDSGERIQMPLKVFNKHPDSVELLADFKAELKGAISAKNNTSRLQRILKQTRQERRHATICRSSWRRAWLADLTMAHAQALSLPSSLQMTTTLWHSSTAIWRF